MISIKFYVFSKISIAVEAIAKEIKLTTDDVQNNLIKIYTA